MFDIDGGDELSETAARARCWARLAETALAHLARVDVSELAPEDQRDVTLQLERARRFTDASEAHLLAALDGSGITDLRSGMATSKWLADRAGLPSGVARRRLVVANQLAAMLPAVEEALSSGRIGFDHAAVFTDSVNERNHTALAPMVDDLIDAASGTVFSRWRANVTALASLLDPDGGHDPDGDLTRNRLTLSPSEGFMLLRGELTGETALSVHDTLNAIADELFAQYSRDRDLFPDAQIPRRSTLMALALEEICRRALAVDRHSTKPPRVEATIILNAGDPSDPTETCVSVVRNLLGSPLPAATLPTFLCDPALHAALIDSLGLPTDMGRATRTVTPAQRRALVLRDGGCTFPGCDCPPAWADAHHVEHWQHGGPTDLDNLTSRSCNPFGRCGRGGQGPATKEPPGGPWGLEGPGHRPRQTRTRSRACPAPWEPACARTLQRAGSTDERR